MITEQSRAGAKGAQCTVRAMTNRAWQGRGAGDKELLTVENKNGQEWLSKRLRALAPENLDPLLS